MEEAQSKIRTFIVDDEFHARENLKILLEDFCPEVKIVGEADGMKKALELIPATEIDLLFLDIRMPSGSEGFDLLESLPKIDFQVIFVTAFKDYAIRAFQANAIHYLLKPVDPEELQQALTKVLEYREAFVQNNENLNHYTRSLQQLSGQINTGSGPEKITVHHNKGFKIIELKDILRLEASGNCTWIHFRDGSKYFDTRTLGIYENLLPEEKFMRIHKSHIISLNAVKEYQSGAGPLVVLSDKSEVPVSRSRLGAFLDLMKGNNR